MSIPKLITKADAADVFHVCVKTIDNYIRDGRLPKPVQFGSKEYWHPADFDAFLDATFRHSNTANASTSKTEEVGEETALRQPSAEMPLFNFGASSGAKRGRAREAERLRQLNR